jgi:hypothetical protein
MRVFGFAVVVAASLVFAQHPSAQVTRAADKPQKLILIVDEGPAPATLKSLAARADAIVVGRVRSVGDAPEALIGASTPLAVHFDSLDVLETMKSSSKAATPAGALRLMQFGGTIESSGRQVETRNGLAIGFKKDHEFVLFVRKHPLTDAYVLVSSVMGAFEVGADTRFVAVPEQARALPELDGRTWMPLGEFRAIVQDAR